MSNAPKVFGEMVVPEISPKGRHYEILIGDAKALANEVNNMWDLGFRPLEGGFASCFDYAPGSAVYKYVQVVVKK